MMSLLAPCVGPTVNANAAITAMVATMILVFMFIPLDAGLFRLVQVSRPDHGLRKEPSYEAHQLSYRVSERIRYALRQAPTMVNKENRTATWQCCRPG